MYEVGQTFGNPQKPINDYTIRRRFIAKNIRCRRLAREPILIIRHRQERLQWTMQRQNWRHQQWRNIVFPDESISNADDRTRVLWSHAGRYANACIMERDSWGGTNIMVWNGIGLNFKLGPVIFQNIGSGRGNGVTVARYIDQILRPHVLSLFFTFQDDNARAHSARATKHHIGYVVACFYSGRKPDWTYERCDTKKN